MVAAAGVEVASSSRNNVLSGSGARGHAAVAETHGFGELKGPEQSRGFL